MEVATALQVRLLRNQARRAEVHLISSGDRLCANYSPAISLKITRSIEELGIFIHLNERVEQILENHIQLKDGIRLEFTNTFVSIPVIPNDITFWPNDLARDDQGFLLIDSKLRLTENIFAVGDFVSFQSDLENPKSGVSAIHQGRHLVRSLRLSILNKQPTDFVRTKGQLNILITGDQRARAVWGNYSVEGKLMMKLKNWIDQRYMNSFY